MNKTNQSAYLAPQVEVIEWSVEQGFALSNSTMEQVGDEEKEIEW